MLLANTGCITCPLLGDPVPGLPKTCRVCQNHSATSECMGSSQTHGGYVALAVLGRLCRLLAAQLYWKGFVRAQLGTSGSSTASVFPRKTWGQEILKCFLKHKHMDLYVTKASIFSALKVSVCLSLL